MLSVSKDADDEQEPEKASRAALLSRICGCLRSYQCRRRHKAVTGMTSDCGIIAVKGSHVLFFTLDCTTTATTMTSGSTKHGLSAGHEGC